MNEVIFNYEEFKAKVDPSKPIHHCARRKPTDKHGILCRIIFRIYGIDKTHGHILIFEARKRTTAAELDEHLRRYQEFAETLAKPLGSTEGAWAP